MFTKIKKFRNNPEFLQLSVAVLGFSLGCILFAHGGSYVADFVRGFVFAAAVFTVFVIGVFSCVIFRHGIFSVQNKFSEESILRRYFLQNPPDYSDFFQITNE